MKLRLSIALCAGALAGCADETVSGYAQPGAEFRLRELNGAPFTARATLSFPEKGRIAGQAPCNSYSAEQKAVYPWFEAGAIAATRMACPDLEAEGDFFQALGAARIVEVSGPVLILSNESGLEMVFRAD